VPCDRLSWPSRQLLSARKSTVSYRIVVIKATTLVLMTYIECDDDDAVVESSGGVMTSVQVRCVIERVVDGCTSSPVDSTTAELDSVAAVPASLPFHDLPHFILITRGYSTAESLACRGMYLNQGCGLGLETHQRLVSVSSRHKITTSRSRLFASRPQDVTLPKLV